jgi:nucleoid DNA-binding protein
LQRIKEDRMDELVQLVSEKAGVSEDQARQAVDTVVEYLKEKLPEPIAGQIEKAVSGSGDVDVQDLAKGLGGMLGKK